jgi:hypothetical protein
MKLLGRSVFVCLFSLIALSAIPAQPAAGSGNSAQDNDPRRAETYNCWYGNREKNPAGAYECGKRYLAQFSGANAFSAAVEKFVWEYDNPDKVNFEGLFRAVDAGTEPDQPALLARLFTTGEALLKREPQNLSLLIRLGYAGYIAEKRKIETYRKTADPAAENAVKQLDAGVTPDDSFHGYPPVYLPRSAWIPFESKDDALAHLEYARGVMNQGSAPELAAAAFYRSTQFDTALKQDPLVFALLAIAYDTSAWEKASSRYRKQSQAPPPEQDPELQNLFAITDRLMVYYAHAIALAGDDPLRKQIHDTAATRLEVLYKFRHANSAAGLPDYLKSAGLESPADPNAPLAITPPAG